MTIWKDYQLVYSLSEALEALNNAGESARFVSGGSDLLLEMQQGNHSPIHTLIDLNHIEDMKVLREENNEIYIGASVPVSIITHSDLIKKHAMAVSEATGLIGGPQVRNTATLGGNVAHALPAADGMISLVAMDATAIIFSHAGYSEKHILGLFKGPGISALSKDEILVGFKFPSKQIGEGSVFDRVMRPQGVALPILNLAVWLRRKNGIVDDIRIVFGPSGPVPTRALQVENIFRGRQLTNEIFLEANKSLLETVKFRTSKMRATAEYRYHLAQKLLEKVVRNAWLRAGEDL
ncbi:MAG TPA: FAD binding domain-containing protein [Anaerolineaceae bacterium]|nr:FAD binding domain-containing protein [Anaerolineaceae bacterium]